MIERGAFADATDGNGRTALKAGEERGHTEALNLLKGAAASQ